MTKGYMKSRLWNVYKRNFKSKTAFSNTKSGYWNVELYERRACGTLDLWKIMVLQILSQKKELATTEKNDRVLIVTYR